jgi:hypothetical protein
VCGQWGSHYAYHHTFKVRREDGWNLQMELIKTTVKHYSQGGRTHIGWYLEICISRNGAPPLTESISTD